MGVFNEMHDCVLDYTDLLGSDWVKRPTRVVGARERNVDGKSG